MHALIKGSYHIQCTFYVWRICPHMINRYNLLFALIAIMKITGLSSLYYDKNYNVKANRSRKKLTILPDFFLCFNCHFIMMCKKTARLLIEVVRWVVLCGLFVCFYDSLSGNIDVIWEAFQVMVIFIYCFQGNIFLLMNEF